MANDYSAEALARRNTLACLDHNRRCYLRAENADMAALFHEAIKLRLEMIDAGEVRAGQWQASA